MSNGSYHSIKKLKTIKKMSKTAIMGFGNPVRSDDAVGIYVIEELKKKIGKQENISIFDMGTAAFEVLFGLKGHQKIILVDGVVNSEQPVGTIFRVPAAEVLKTSEENPQVFLHSMKWDQALSYAKKILREEYPEDIEVFLISIENIKLDVDLSEEVQKAGDKVVQYILEEIEIVLEK